MHSCRTSSYRPFLVLAAAFFVGDPLSRASAFADFPLSLTFRFRGLSAVAGFALSRAFCFWLSVFAGFPPSLAFHFRWFRGLDLR